MSEKAQPKPSYGTSSTPPSRRNSDDKGGSSSRGGSPYTPKLQKEKEKEENSNALYLSFIAMVIVGVGNQIYGKLQTLPMHNYPFFQNIQATFVYIPISFAYIWLQLLFGSNITKEQTDIPKYKFAIMGLFDCVSGLMSTFAVNYIPSGGLIVLLTQSSIPISMYISRVFLNAHYTRSQYLGASIVMVGILIVLLPDFMGGGADHNPDASPTAGHNQWIWIIVMVLSCIPATISSVYKEMALDEVEIDVIYLNGWVSLFQFLINIPFAVPSAWLTGLKTRDIPSDIIAGSKCYWGIDTILTPTAYGPPDDCREAFLYTNAYLAFNIIFNVLTITILKYGSSNLLYIASTIMLPINNLAFSLKIMPGHQPMHLEDFIGLFVILTGLLVYRYFNAVIKYLYLATTEITEAEKKLIQEVELECQRMSKKTAKFLGIDQAEMVGPIVDHRLHLARQKSMQKTLHRSARDINKSFILKLGIAHPQAHRLAENFKLRHHHVRLPPGTHHPHNNRHHNGGGGGSGGSSHEREPLVPPV